MLSAMHPVVSVALYHPASSATSIQSLPGGVQSPVLSLATRLIGTYDMEVEDITADVRRGLPLEEGVRVRLALRLWPRDITPTYLQGQEVVLTNRGRSHQLRVDEVTGPWVDGDPDDHVELLCVDRATAGGSTR